MYTTGSSPVSQSLRVSPPRKSGCVIAYDSARCFRATAVNTNSRATRHAAGGNGMSFWGTSAGMNGPVGFLFSTVAVFEKYAPRTAAIPASRTRPEIQGSNVLNRLELTSRFGPSSTVIVVIDASNRKELEDRRLAPDAPRLAQRIAHLAHRRVDAGGIDD